MTRRLEKLPTPQGIGQNQTATLTLPPGPTYHSLLIRAATAGGDLTSAQFKDGFGDIRLIADGNTKIEASADYLVKRAHFYNRTVQDGVLPIFLGNPWARTIGGEDLTAYGTQSGVSSLTLEIDIKAWNFTKLQVYAVQSEPQPFGLHSVIRRFARGFSSVGVDEVADLPTGTHNLMGIDIENADLDGIEVLADGYRVHNSDARIRAQTLSNSGRFQQIGMTHIDFVRENRIAFPNAAGGVDVEAFPMLLNDFRMKLDFTTAPGSYNIYETTIQGA